MLRYGQPDLKDHGWDDAVRKLDAGCNPPTLTDSGHPLVTPGRACTPMPAPTKRVCQVDFVEEDTGLRARPPLPDSNGHHAAASAAAIS